MWENEVKGLHLASRDGKLVLNAGSPSRGFPGPRPHFRLQSEAARLQVLQALYQGGRPFRGPGFVFRKGATMPRSVNRSASSGRFVTKAAAARWPGKTTTERVGSGTSNNRSVNRSASSGRFVTDATAKRNPGGTINQQI